jgi:signal peptidase I
MPRKCSFVGQNPRGTLKCLLVTLILVLAVRKWVWMPVLMVGDSMAPTFHGGQLVLVNKIVYRFRLPARGEIVIIWTGTEYMTKRIIGLPGEEVALHAGKLLVDGRLYLEPYVKDPGDLEILPGRIPANSFAVIGDRRSGTIIAIVNQRRVVGKVVL